MIYLDYNSTAPYSSNVVRYLRENMADQWGNASSEHEIGYHLVGQIKNDRSLIADFLDCSTKKILFTAGATESINSVLSPINLNAYGLKKIITSPLEHHATLSCCERLKKNGTEIFYVGNDESGKIDLTNLKNLCEKHQNSLISLAFINNETGVIFPVEEIIQIAHDFKCLVHLDSVQALGKYHFSLDDLDVDFASFSGHKIGSFNSIGLLLCKTSGKISTLYSWR